MVLKYFADRTYLPRVAKVCRAITGRICLPRAHRPHQGGLPTPRCHFVDMTEIDSSKLPLLGKASLLLENQGSSPRRINHIKDRERISEITEDNDYAVTFQAGRLRLYQDTWQSMEAPIHILKIIQGYRIPFVEKPPLRCMYKNRNRLITTPALESEINQMLEESVIEKAPSNPGFLSIMFPVKKSDGSQRPVLNLKALNLYLRPKKFRLINVQKVPHFLQTNDFMMKLDLHQAYFHIPILESHRRFLRFIFNDITYQMTCLPFGIASAPRTFATLSNWVAQKLREKGIRILVYLDDFLMVNQCPYTLGEHMKEATNLLTSLGWIINRRKSSTVPSQEIEFLGILWNTRLNEKSLPRKKTVTLSKRLIRTREAKTLTLLALQKVIGTLQFASFVVHFGIIHYRNLQSCLHQALKLKKAVLLTPAAREDINWWMQNTHTASKIWADSVSYHIVTDASGVGWGAYVNGAHIQGSWMPEELRYHANMKELLAIYKVLTHGSIITECRNKTILIQSDSRTALAYLRKQGGTRSVNLFQLTRLIYRQIEAYNISLVTSYLPGPLNSVADGLSRCKALAEWHLIPRACQLIFNKWGTPDVDLMASKRAHVVPRYVSLDLMDRNAFYHDAFSRIWKHRLAWIFPPPCLMYRVLASLNQAQGIFIVICPRWNNVFWRADLKKRAVSPPFTIWDLESVLIDTRTNLPPARVNDLVLEAWRCQGGVIS